MCLRFLVLCLSLGVLVKCAAANEWCYHGCDYSPKDWSKIAGSQCGEKKQSPININTYDAVTDDKLLDFKFVNFSSPQVIKSIANNGHTVVCTLEANVVEVSGGGLNGTYSVAQFHFHMGDGTHDLPGSEHTINGHRYPVEMHIVGMKKGLPEKEFETAMDAYAVLGFFLSATEEPMSESWEMLGNLTKLKEGSMVEIRPNISIDGLIENVDLTKYYRYMGSLTTPNCNQAVVWTVFHEPIGVSQELIDMFSIDTGIVNNYRPIQDLNGREVLASAALSHSWCYDGHCEPLEYKPIQWYLLPGSKCGEKNQSPINIETSGVEIDPHLGDFKFTNFANKHAIKHITNTGHSVKCVLEDGMVEVSGGGLGHVYSTLQFHFHWGSDHGSEGSEHTVDSKRYPMEVHIVNKRKDLSLEEALKQRDGLAVLGFFIEAVGTKSSTGSSGQGNTNPTSSASNKDAWTKLTNHLSDVATIGSTANFTEEISIDDLLGSVDRSAYYRYSGSLTTPLCNEAVVWTVFKESVVVDQSLMQMFPSKAEFHDVFRPTQALNGRKIYSTSSSSIPGPILLLVLLTSLCAFFM